MAGTVRHTTKEVGSGLRFGLRPRFIGLLHLPKPPESKELKDRFRHDGWFCMGTDVIHGVTYFRFRKLKDWRNLIEVNEMLKQDERDRQGMFDATEQRTSSV